MSLGINIKVTGDAKLISKLNKLGKGLMEWHDALEESGKNLVEYYGGQAFDSQGGDFGTPWERLSPSTVAFKIEHFPTFAAMPLIATGNMKQSFTHQAGTTHMEVKNTADYFKYHQSTEERHKIPRRPMIAINKNVKEIVRRAFYKAMVAKVEGL